MTIDQFNNNCQIITKIFSHLKPIVWLLKPKSLRPSPSPSHFSVCLKHFIKHFKDDFCWPIFAWEKEVQSFAIGYWFYCFFIKEFHKQWNRLKDWVMNFIILFKNKIKITKRERHGEWVGRYSNWLSLLSQCAKKRLLLEIIGGKNSAFTAHREGQ